MLDVALVNYVGAGWCSLAPAHGLELPQGAVASGKILLQSMHQQEPAETQAFVESTVQAIWTDWLSSGMPESVALSHLEILPRLIQEHQPATDTIIAAIAITTATNKLGPAAINAQARRLSSEIVERARENNFFQKFGISDGVTFYFLEAIYGQLLRAWPVVDCANTQLRYHCDAKPWQFNAEPPAVDEPPAIIEHAEPELQTSEATTTESQPSPTAPVESDEQPTSASDTPPLEMLQASIAKRFGPTGLNDLQKTFFTHHYEDLLRILGDNAIPTDELATFARSAEQLLGDGEFAQADLALSSLEQSLEDIQTDDEASIGNIDSWLARCRSWRAKLTELQFDFRRAARHYEVSAKHLPRENYTGRWTYTARQIQALAWQHRMHGDVSALDEAIKIGTGFIMILHDTNKHVCQAHAKAQLARILLTAAEQKNDTDQLELAARNISEAIDAFEQEGLVTDKSDAVILLADIFNELGRTRGNAEHLEDAVRAYQAALGSDSLDVDDGERRMLGAKLGVALARLGQSTKNDELRTLSIETLQKALSKPAPEPATLHSSAYLPRAFASLGDMLASDANETDAKTEVIKAYETANELTYLDPGYPLNESTRDALQALKADLGLEQADDPATTPTEHQVEEVVEEAHPSEATARSENHYLARLRETLREAHANQSKPRGSKKLSA